MPEAYSIRESLQGALQDFIRETGFQCIHLEEIIRELVGLLAHYREEGLPLFPEIFVFSSIEGLKALAPSSDQITIGTAALVADSAATVVKNCARLSAGGWAVFVVKENEQLRYGLFRAIRHSLATAAEESMGDLGRELPVILIRNRGPQVVELRSTLGKRFTASLTTTPPEASPLDHNVEQFVEVGSLIAEGSESFKPYLRRLLTEILQHCHGSLLAVIPPQEGGHPTLTDGVWLKPCVRLASLYGRACSTGTADALADLSAAEALINGMINSDGVVVFGSDGSVLAYRVFLKPEENERDRLPERGGGRRRTYELMKLRLNTTFKAVFFRSQDGEMGCERS